MPSLEKYNSSFWSSVRTPASFYVYQYWPVDVLMQIWWVKRASVLICMSSIFNGLRANVSTACPLRQGQGLSAGLGHFQFSEVLRTLYGTDHSKKRFLCWRQWRWKLCTEHVTWSSRQYRQVGFIHSLIQQTALEYLLSRGYARNWRISQTHSPLSGVYNQGDETDR